ncbi:MAG: FkbM family methyltransferase [Selenomonadaceae bacterium]|nr:FkbM family methyltransferase [Selenomonadaceae bacterium]
MRENGVEVACFADDDKEKQVEGFVGLPVIATEQLSKMGGGKNILISSYGPEKVVKRLKTMDVNLLDRLVSVDFYLWEGGLDYYNYYLEHGEEIETADALLADDKSRKVFYNLLQYKISRDPKLIAEIRDDACLQYFDLSVIRFGEGEVFLDLGAYNGDTVEAFAERMNGKYREIIAMEPDAENYVKLRAVADRLRNVKCYPYGVGESDGTIRFSANATQSSFVADNGETEIEIRSVDSLMAGRKLTFLKADIEGLEKQMLAGAAKTIAEQSPQMAIAVYHCKEDIFRIINTIHSYSRDYAFYLCHYTEMPIDTVLYAVLKN